MNEVTIGEIRQGQTGKWTCMGTGKNQLNELTIEALSEWQTKYDFAPAQWFELPIVKQ